VLLHGKSLRKKKADVVFTRGKSMRQKDGGSRVSARQSTAALCWPFEEKKEDEDLALSLLHDVQLHFWTSKTSTLFVCSS
jgi:hypothetical protein